MHMVKCPSDWSPATERRTLLSQSIRFGVGHSTEIVTATIALLWGMVSGATPGVMERYDGLTSIMPGYAWTLVMTALGLWKIAGLAFHNDRIRLLTSVVGCGVWAWVCVRFAAGGVLLALAVFPPLALGEALTAIRVGERRAT